MKKALVKKPQSSGMFSGISNQILSFLFDGRDRGFDSYMGSHHITGSTSGIPYSGTGRSKSHKGHVRKIKKRATT